MSILALIRHLKKIEKVHLHLLMKACDSALY